MQERLDRMKEEIIPMDQLWIWSRQLISALYFCHEEAHVIHRDIKPENLMIDESKDLVLIDFGISIRFEGENDLIKGTAGTMYFYAPEIVKGGKNKVIHGKKIDIWASGVSLYNMASGKLPFTANTMIALQRQIL